MFDQAEVEDDDRDGDKHGAGREPGKMCFRQVEQAHGYRPHIAVLQQELGQQHVAPGPRKLRQHRVHQHRFTQRQGHFGEYLQVGSTVQSRSLEDGVGNGIEVALLYHVAQGRRCGIVKDQGFQLVDEAQLRHDDVDCRHTHEAGEHTQYQRGLLDGVSALETEPGHDIARQQHEDRTKEGAAGGDIQGVEEPRLVGIEAVHVIVKQVDEGLEAIFLWEEPLEVI